MEALDGANKPYSDDIGELVHEFGQWQKDTLDTWRENCKLKEKLHSLIAVTTEKDAVVKSLMSELQELKTVINSLHQTLSKRCDLDDENRKLNKTINELQQREKAITEEHQKEIEQHLNELKDTKERSQTDLEKQRIDLINLSKEDTDKLRDQLQQNEQEIAELKKQVKQVEEEKCTEAIRLRSEFDKKLQRYQKQAVKSQTVQNGTINQEIFRKKLQHMKAESEREVSNLKRTISDLQQQLSNHQQKKDNETAFPKLKRQRRV